MTTQSKFEDKLEEIAAKHQLDLVVDKSYANCGTFSFQKPDSFAPLLAFKFSFQSGYAGFDDLHESIGNNDRGGRWTYVEAVKFDEVLEKIDAHLRGD